MNDGLGRFTEENMTLAMRDIAHWLGTNCDDAQLLGLTNNAVFALPAAGIVIRIARSHGLHDRIHKVARLARWFAEIGAPTIHLVPRLDQPMRTGELLATVWRYVESATPVPSVDELGRVLRVFHRLGTPPFALPRWDPVGDARRRINDAEALAYDDRCFLLDWCRRLESAVDAMMRRDQQLVHGDAHVGNLLRAESGEVVFCDFDSTCVGPWQVDLAAVAVGEVRYGRPGTHAILAETYGYDVTTDPDWQTLREARELKLVVAPVPLLASAPRFAEQFALRLQSIVDGDLTARWTRFADLNC